MIDKNKNISIKIVTFENYDKLINVERIFVIKIKKIDIFDKFNNRRVINDKNNFNDKSKYNYKRRNHDHNVVSKN